MDKAKIINLFFLAFLASFLIQAFLLPKPTTQVAKTGVVIGIQKDSLVVPNIPHIELTNYTTGAVTDNPCTDITIQIEGYGTMQNIATDAPTFCTPVSLAASEKKSLSFSPLYKLFATQAGKYLITVKTTAGESMVSFTLEQPGVFRSFLSTMVYQPIYNLFVALLTWLPGHPLGWAIIIVTIIIRLILLVPQQHMLEGQKKMQKLQPKLKALQEEYKNDQATLGAKMLELYQKEKVNPLGSILPLLIQMPILIGLYWVVSQINDPSNFYHLYSFFRNFDPTQINTHFYGFNLAHVGGIVGGVFALILGALQYVQAKLSFGYNAKKDTKPVVFKDGESPEVAALDPAVMQKMMIYFFPIMIAATSYFFPLGVGLYWFIGTLFVIAQQWYVNRKK